MKRYGLTMLTAAATLAMAACDSDEMVTPPITPTTFEVTVENVSAAYDFPASGVFNTPAGTAGPGPLLPGGVYEFSFMAAPGSYLSFATMFVQSNDWFYGTRAKGVKLFNNNGRPRSRDITGQVRLFDAGTEADQLAGFGSDQAPRQAGPDTGDADDNRRVRRIRRDVTDELRVTIAPATAAPSSGAPSSGRPNG